MALLVPIKRKRSHDISFQDELVNLHSHSHGAHHQNVTDVLYEDDLVKHNSALQEAWNEALDTKYLATPTRYDRVEVLMLSWEEKHDDLGVREEMNQLETVFRDDYKFNVTRKKIYNHNKKTKRPQTQMNYIVSRWVYENEGQETLLIVYFAGHGENDSTQERLVLDGRIKYPHDLARYRNTVNWNRTEQCLLDIGSDVLQIFDCCFAGAAQGSQGGVSQICEYLAACDGLTETRAPGKNSFTMALIWALKNFKDRRFTVAHLINEIRRAPDFPDEQRPRLLQRRYDNDSHDNGRLILRAFDRKSDAGPNRIQKPLLESENDSQENMSNKDILNEDVLPLQLVFGSRPGPDKIRKLAKGLGNLIQGERLDISGIILGDLRPRENKYAVLHNPWVHLAILRFKSKLLRSQRHHTDPEALANRIVQQIENVSVQKTEEQPSKRTKM